MYSVLYREVKSTGGLPMGVFLIASGVGGEV